MRNMGKNILKIDGPSRKLGVKYLDDAQLTSSFPDWRALLSRIEEQRQIAEFAAEKQYRSEGSHFPQTYDNLFAVLGGRGSGKSSVILTLREKMMHPEKQDILLPIITPEVISERECSILGWIMSATDSVICDLERRIDSLYQMQHNCRSNWNHSLDPFFKDCRFKKDNPLRQSYQELFEKSVSTSGYLDTSGYSAEDAVFYRVKQSRRQYKLIQDLNDFWNQLTDVWYQTYQLELRQKDSSEDARRPAKRPLIVLMFDDIDLVPERSMELLTTTFQYFTNPNIVIILTAAEKILKDVIRLKMFDRLVGSESKALLMDAVPWGHTGNRTYDHTVNLERFESTPIDKMAQEFYDKVIPPSSRYRLRRYESIADKQIYSYSSTGQSFWVPKEGNFSSIPIEKFLADQIEKLEYAFRAEKKKPNIFVSQEKKNTTLQRAYLMIFGEKSRNIANGCLEIMNTFDRLKQLDVHGRTLTREEHQEILLSLRHLVRALLLSKTKLAEYADQVDSFLYAASDQMGCYMDYNFALQCYQKEQRNIQDWILNWRQSNPGNSQEQLARLAAELLGRAQEKIAALMMVMFFAEGILVITDCRRHHIHGHRQLSLLLNADVVVEGNSDSYLSKSLSLFPTHQETPEFLHSFPLVLEHIRRYVGINQYDSQYARDYLEDIFHVGVMQEGMLPITILKKAVNKDREWVKTVLTMLAVRHSGITLVGPNFLYIKDRERRILELFSFTSHFKYHLKNAAQAFLSGADLIQSSKDKMMEFSVLTQEDYKWDHIADTLKSSFLHQSDTIIPLQTRDDQYNAFVENGSLGDKYIKAYFSRRWQTYIRSESESAQAESEPASTVSLCYQLVRFVRDTLYSCVNLLVSQSNIYLSREQINTIRIILQRINDYDLDIKRKKDAWLSTLDRALLTWNTNINDTGVETQDGQLDLLSGVQEHPKNLSIAAGPFIEYLAKVQQFILEPRFDYDYYEPLHASEYFKLTEFLAVYFPPAVENMNIEGLLIPASSMLISELKMLEFLFPYYFAAHMGIVVDSRYQSELPNGETVLFDSLEKKLHALYKQLTGLKSSSKNCTVLCDLMQEAQRELASSYYAHLEEAYE